MTRGRSWLPWVALVGALVLVAVVAGRPPRDGAPLDPSSSGPLGTRALVLLLERLGGEVDRTDLPGDEHDVALLLADRLEPADTARLAAWVRGGGTLVVADPGSPLAAVPVTDEAFAGLVDLTVDRGSCDVAPLRGLDRLDPAGGVSYEVPLGAASCFGDGAVAFVVAEDLADGVIVSIGGAALFTNDALASDDNALLAADLLVPEDGTAVAFLEPPIAGEGQEGLLDLLPDHVGQALVQLGIAFLLYALWRAVRLGRPVVERQPSVIEASEFVAAVGQLLQQRRDPAEAARLLANRFRSTVGERLGTGRDAPAEVVVELVAARTGADPQQLRRQLDPAAVRSDDELVAFAHRLDTLTLEVLRGRPATAARP